VSDISIDIKILGKYLEVFMNYAIIAVLVLALVSLAVYIWKNLKSVQPEGMIVFDAYISPSKENKEKLAETQTVIQRAEETNRKARELLERLKNKNRK
jgi:hypothetical protein